MHRNDHNRSIALSALLPLLEFKATYVSLQRDVRAGDATMLQQRTDLLQFSDELKTFSDAAALISNLDLIISVDTSVAHLAGALAKPVWGGCSIAKTVRGTRLPAFFGKMIRASGITSSLAFALPWTISFKAVRD
jgi:Glycosyltransferase family 9 (heptosyltransferase)